MHRFALLAAIAATLPAQTKLLRFPDLHRDQVVFCYAGDLWRATAAGGNATRLTVHPGLELFPKWSPDGRWIAFTGQIDGDEQVYVMPAEGGEPRQLTFYPATGPLPDRWGFDHHVQGWTRDGQAVVFRSQRDAWAPAEQRLYTVAFGDAVAQSGALPLALPMPMAGSGSFAPDGQRMVYSPLFRDFRTWKRYEGGWAQELYLFDPARGTAENLTNHPRTDRDPMWIGERIWFASDRTGTLNLWSLDPRTKETRQETASETWDVRWPSAADDARIVFEKSGTLWVFDCATRTERELSITVPSDNLAARPGRVDASKNVTGYALSPHGKRALLWARGDVFSVPVEHGTPRNMTRSPDAHDRHAAWSPDGRSLVFVSDRTGEDQLWLVDAKEEQPPRALTEGKWGMLGGPVWSPDSTRIAFGDKDGVLRVLDVETKALVEVANEERGQIDDAVWSADSAFLAFSMTDPNDMPSVYVWARSDSTLRRVTPLHGAESNPSFDPNGERLYFLAARSFAPRVGGIEWNYHLDRQTGIFALALRRDLTALFPPRSDEEELDKPADAEPKKPAEGEAKTDAAKPETAKAAVKPVRIDWEGLEQRVEQVPVPFDNYGGLTAVEAGLVYVRGGGFYYGRETDRPASLMLFDPKKREAVELVAGINGYVRSADGKKLLVAETSGHTLLDATPAGKDGRKKLPQQPLWVERVPAAEWRQIYHEAWRRFRDFFYVDNMHGYDWQALRDQYAELLPHVRHRADLNYVIGELIAELNVGHAYVSGGDWQRPDRVAVALPGARFALDPQHGRYRIAKILRGENDDPAYRSPLTEVGVEVAEGDFVLAIDGDELRATDNPYRLLRGKADRAVRLLVNANPTKEGARTVTFRPISNEHNLVYRQWVEGCRARVAALSQGTLGYLHIPDMGAEGIREFIKNFYPQREKRGLVIDVRANGGGNVSQMILDRLSKRVLMATFGRTTGYSSYPSAAFDGHLVCLLNETSASDGDIFPAMFRRAGLGKLVGKRSWGGIIGITDRGPLLDGGTVSVPEFGNTEVSPEGWTIEGAGVKPDVVVENDVAAVLAGNDPQLEAGVKILLEQLQQDPRDPPVRPPAPDRRR